MEVKHQMIGSTLLYKYQDPVFNEIGIINYKRQLAILIDKYNVKDIILDVEKVKIVDNNGLSAIMFARRYTVANGNTCYLVMPRPKLQSLLKTAKLTKSFEIFKRKEEYQPFLKNLVELADKERAEKEAEKARKAEEIRKQKEEAKKKAAENKENANKEKNHNNNNGESKSKKRVLKKKNNPDV
ncbi:MAG: STAS domain-containing protein [Candidatus Neomarinimicrobiota bacterium]